MTTIRCSSESSGASVVVLQHATEPFTAFDSAHDRTIILIRLDELVTETLMASLGVVVLNVFTNSILK
jgi:hypothetical protein